MKFIYSGKLYNTENSEIVATFKRNWSIKVRNNTYDHVDLYTRIYQTKKGAFYVVAQYRDRAVFDVINKGEVKDILEKNNNVDAYEKLFGELQEA